MLWLALLPTIIWAQEWTPSEWPSLKHYDENHLYHIALPLGGIGTGTVSLGGRGELRDWEIMNVPAKGYSTVTTGNNAPFFAIHVAEQEGNSHTALLSGPLYDHEYLHYEGRPVNHHGLPRFGTCSFDAAYPFGQARLSDKDLPVEVVVKGFNPLIPADAENSGLPVAVLSYEVRNLTDQPMEVSVCGSIRNFIGKTAASMYTTGKEISSPSEPRTTETNIGKRMACAASTFSRMECLTTTQHTAPWLWLPRQQTVFPTACHPLPTVGAMPYWTFGMISVPTVN